MKRPLPVIIAFLIILIMAFSGTVKAEEATGEAENILDKIKQKVESIRKNPKAYIGSVTDKTESSLQIKDMSGIIQQISIKDSTSFAKNGKNQTNIKFSDVAIGDFVVAMGLTNGNNLLDADRVLLTSPIEEPDRKIIYGMVTEIGKNEATVKDSNQVETVLSFPTRWKGADIKELQNEMRVMAVTVEDDGKLVVRTLEIILTDPSPTPTEESQTN